MKSIPFGALIVFCLGASGCASLLVEKESEILIIPADSKKVFVYNVLEGISSPDGDEKRLEDMKKQLDHMKQPQFHFLTTGIGGEKDVQQHCRIGPSRFFQDPKRERKLCMDRTVVILDRDAFAKSMNQLLSKTGTELLKGSDEKKFMEDLAKEKKSRPNRQPISVLEGVLMLIVDFDSHSIRKIKDAAKTEFQWVRFDRDTVRITIPATPECAKRIAADTKSKDWLKAMRRFADPVSLTTDEDGIRIVFGGEGKVVRLTRVSESRYRAADENALIEHAGSPKVLMFDGKNANAEVLIEQFIAEKTKKR